MPAVSQKEWLDRSRGVDTADGHEEQLEQHAKDDISPPAPPRAETPRPFAARRYGISQHTSRKFKAADRPDRSQEGHNAPDPSAGHAAGIPKPKPVLPGTHHYADPAPPAEHRPLDVGPAKPYYSGGMAHGVPAPPQHGGRPAPPDAEQLAARAREEAVLEEGKSPDPVPVYIVQKGSGARPSTRAALRSVAIAAAGADPQVLVPRNPHRSKVRLLNESAVAVRITFDLTLSGGALLPASMTSYLEIATQDEICAYCPTGGPALVSVIDQYDVPGGG